MHKNTSHGLSHHLMIIYLERIGDESTGRYVLGSFFGIPPSGDILKFSNAGDGKGPEILPSAISFKILLRTIAGFILTEGKFDTTTQLEPENESDWKPKEKPSYKRTTICRFGYRRS